MKSFTALLAVVALSTAPALATAEEQNSVVIDLAGVDLTSDAGAGHALRRIERAAERACDARTGPQELEERRAARACVRDATERAVADLDAPLVSARFSAETRIAQGIQRRSR